MTVSHKSLNQEARVIAEMKTSRTFTRAKSAANIRYVDSGQLIEILR